MTVRRLLVTPPLLLLPFILALAPSADAQSAGYNWETSVLSPFESWDQAEAVPYVRVGEIQNLTVDEDGMLSVPYQIGLRFPGTFSCLTSHEVTVEVRLTRMDKVFRDAPWANESLEPLEQVRLMFHLPEGSHPTGIDWTYQEGPNVVLRWNLSAAPANATVPYFVTAVPVPLGETPADCYPAGPDDGVRYLSRLVVARPPPLVLPTPGEARGLGLEGAVFALAGFAIAVGVRLRR